MSGCWNRGVPLYTEVFSFLGVEIEEFPCIQRCLIWGGGGIEEFHCIKRCFQGVEYCMQKCSYFRGLEWRSSTTVGDMDISRMIDDCNRLL